MNVQPQGFKSLHLTNAWHATSGGIGTFYKAMFEAAERERHHMRLVVPGETARTEEVGEFVKIHYLKAPLAPLNQRYRMIYPQRFLFPKTAVQRILNEEKPDLVEISEKYTLNYLAGLLRTGRLPGVSIRPAVVGISHERMDENMSAYLSGSPTAQKFCRWYMKWIYFPMFDHHIANSEHTAEELIQVSRGHKVRRGIWVCPMGVDSDLFTPARRTVAGRKALLRQIGASENSTVLLYAGRLSPEKNVTLLVETMLELREDSDFHLVIAGSGMQLEQLRASCALHGLKNVHFFGHVENRDSLANLFASADSFLHPNPKEPFGIAPLEAMAAGLALIAPNSGGVTSYAHEGNAWLGSANPGEFASAARFIRANPAIRAARTAAARETAERFRWSTITTRFLHLYRELTLITRDQRIQPTIQPRTYSTPGDYLGREIPASQ